MMKNGFSPFINNSVFANSTLGEERTFEAKNHLFEFSNCEKAGRTYNLISGKSARTDIFWAKELTPETNHPNLVFLFYGIGAAPNCVANEINRDVDNSTYFSVNNINEQRWSTLQNIYVKSAEGKEGEALKYLYSVIERAFSSGNTELVDEILESFDPDRVGRMVSVGLVRATFRARSELKHWQSCLASVAYYLTQNDQSPSHILRGLFKVNGRTLLAKKLSV